MKTTTYYDLNIVEGTDIVNPLTVDNPNYQKIDETMHDNAVAGVTLATELTNATIHALTRENSDCSVIRFIATSRWKAGDSVTVDGVPVLALLPSGETLPDGAYVINANVLCVLTGTNLTVYVSKSTANASDITYKETNVEEALNSLNESMVTVTSDLSTVSSNVSTLNRDLTLDYSNANGEVQDLHTFLQMALEKLFPKAKYLIQNGIATNLFSTNAATSSMNVSAGTGYIRMQSSGDGMCCFTTPISTNNYSTLKVRLKSTTNNSNFIGVSTNTEIGSSSVANYVINPKAVETTNITTISINVSDLQGEYYFKAYQYNGAFDLYDMWLE